MSVRSIGKYEIVSTLGRGSMGVVYKGRDPEIGRLVAIKTLKSVFMGDDPAGNEALQRFRQESRSAGKLQHPNIVTIFEAGRTENGSPYIVMEYIEGKSIEILLSEGGGIEPPAIVHYLAQIASAIDYAHSQNVIHRDIKPSNILVDGRHISHLLDFGVAKLSDTSLTPAGTVVGTPSYMSPEQIRGMSLDGRTDLFSLGVVAFEAFTGVRPFPGTDFTTVVSNIIHKEPLTFLELGVEVPAGVEKILGKVLSKERDERFTSALEFVHTLAKELDLKIDGSGIIGGYRQGMAWGSNDCVSTVPGMPAFAKGVEIKEKKPSHEPRQPLASNTPDSLPSSPESLSSGSSDDSSEFVHSDEAQAQATTESRSETASQPGTRTAVLDDAQVMLQGSGKFAFLKQAAIFSFGAVVALCVSYFVFAPGSRENENSSRMLAEVKAPHLGVTSEGKTQTPTTPSLAIFEPEAGDKSATSTKPNSESLEVSEINIIELSDADLRRVLSWKDAQAQILQLAVREAGERKGEALLPELLALLGHPNFSVRVAVLKALGQEAYLNIDSVVLAIIGRLDDEDPIVRGFSAKILGKLEREDVRLALAARLKKEESEVVVRVLKQGMKR